VSLWKKLWTFVEDTHWGIPAAAFVGALGIESGICTVFHIRLDATTTVILGFLLVIAPLAALIYRQAKALQVLEHRVKKVEVPELQEDISALISEVEPKFARRFQNIVTKLEDEIYRLEDERRHRINIEIPGTPALIPSGKFLMGIDDGAPDEGPTREVLVHAFMIDRYPVTNLEFVDFLHDASNEIWLPENVRTRYGIPYYLVEWQGLAPAPEKWDHPVVWIGWYASAAFCNWRSRRDKLDEVYRFITPTQVQADVSRNGWRLPTEAEWEKAARAGTSGRQLPLKGGELSPSLANYGGYRRGTTSVGLFPPNDLDVCDMLGNVKEWCHNWYTETLDSGAATEGSDGQTDKSDGRKAFRGGGWMDRPEWVVPWRRGNLPPFNTNPDCGFRCVCQP
jgi:formylglycine-generating enzyme required for sulfatase activity